MDFGRFPFSVGAKSAEKKTNEAITIAHALMAAIKNADLFVPTVTFTALMRN